MPNPSGPDREGRSNAAGFDPDEADSTDVNTDSGNEATEAYRTSSEADPATEVMAQAQRENDESPSQPQRQQRERRFTAPGFDAKETTVIDTASEPATEAFQQGSPPTGQMQASPRTAVPQVIPPRLGAKLLPSTQRSWGWVLALILIILALAAIAVMATVMLSHGHKRKAASQEDQVRGTIQRFDIAVQNGDLAALRSVTCGDIRDGYVNYDEQAWTETYQRIAAAKQYPVVASIDQVVVDNEHAEANVTAFMAYAPQTRSTRSFDLQYRDDQWKICQSTTG